MPLLLKSKAALAFFAVALLCHAQAQGVMLGVDVFLKGYTHLVKGKRVGLITNHTGKNTQGQATIDLLYQHPNVKLVALFAPEHGIRGKIAAGIHIKETVDTRTRLPIYSLYGGNDHRPPKVALEGLDVVAYDIQDVGSRCYTYIWSLAEAMAAAGENGKTVIVFDRPCPQGGLMTDGPVTEQKWLSFIGLYPIPRVYGMTVGETALYLKREHIPNCPLIVIPMAGYSRAMTWQQTGQTWIGPSPNIPSVESAICFPATGTIGTLGNMHIGIGTQWPFQMVGASWLDANEAANVLNSYRFPGVRFLPFSFDSRGKPVNAVFLHVTEPTNFHPAVTEVAILHYLNSAYPRHFSWPRNQYNSFDKAMGTSRVRQMIQQGKSVREIVDSWRTEVAQYNQKRQKYLLYK